MASIYKFTQKRNGKSTVYHRVAFMHEGTRRMKQFKTARAARLFLESLSQKLKEMPAVRGRAAGPTVAELAAQWLQACAVGRDGAPPLEPTTVAWYRGHVEHHIVPILGAHACTKVTADDVRGMRDELLAGELSRTTVKKVMTTFKTLVGYGLETGAFVADPTHRVTVKLSSREKKRIEIHTKEEMQRILRVAEEYFPRYRDLLSVLVYAGLRLSEVRGLTRGDLDAAKSLVKVTQRVDKKGLIGLPKSAAGTRQVHIPQLVVAQLERRLRQHQFDLIFCTRNGRPLSNENIRKRFWLPVQLKAGVRAHGLHACRHFFAARQIEDGVDARELSELLGHSDPGFTLRTYGHLFRDRDSEARRRARAEKLVLA